MSNRGSGSEQEFRKLPTPTSTHAGELARAQEEEQQIEKAARQHKRDETIRNIIGCGMYVLVSVIFVIIIGAVGMLGYHLLFPTRHHLLDPDELQNVKDFVLNGAIVGLGTSYFRQYLEAKRT